MKKFRIVSLALSLLLFASSVTKAADNFTLIATSGGNSATKGFVTAEDFFGGLTLSALQAALPSYTDTSAANPGITNVAFRNAFLAAQHSVHDVVRRSVRHDWI